MDMSLMEKMMCNLVRKRKTLSGNDREIENRKPKNKNLPKINSENKYRSYNSNPSEAYPRTCRKASMTVEAAVVLPLFVGFMVFLMFFFRIMQVQIGVEQAMAYTARVTAASARETTKKISKAKVRLLFTDALRREGVPLTYIDGGVSGISIRKSDFSGEEIVLRTNYKTTLPIGFFGKLSYKMKQEVSSRKWTGWVEEDGSKEDGTYVYVTETGKAYHRSRDCSYLDLSIHKVSAFELGEKRNKSGGRYKACSSCGKRGKKALVYYITDYGDSYHSSLSCSGLKRTVYLIPMKKVGNRHACKKCAGG